jgi:hypothetical protein
MEIANPMAQTKEHKHHIASRVAWNNCQECRADCERQFADTSIWRYGHIAEYLAYVKPRLDTLRAGYPDVDGQIWLRRFRLALNRRIGMKVHRTMGRKYADGYLDRLKQWKDIYMGRYRVDADYLRVFARRGASTLERY